MSQLIIFLLGIVVGGVFVKVLDSLRQPPDYGHENQILPSAESAILPSMAVCAKMGGVV